MRVIFVVVVLALAAVGCEKTPPSAGESGKQLSPTGEATKPGAAAPAATPVKAHDEPAGEPMDDVDEAESPSDKSGAGDPAEGDGPEGEELDVEE